MWRAGSFLLGGLLVCSSSHHLLDFFHLRFHPLSMLHENQVA